MSGYSGSPSWGYSSSGGGATGASKLSQLTDVTTANVAGKQYVMEATATGWKMVAHKSPTPTPSNAVQWDSQTSYVSGAVVSFNGKIY